MMRCIWICAFLVPVVLSFYPNSGAPRKEPRIVDGRVVPIGKWKGLALLEAYYPVSMTQGSPNEWSRVQCGAAIISDSLVLTAAQCFWRCWNTTSSVLQCDPIYKADPRYWRVNVGEVEVAKMDDGVSNWPNKDNGVEEIFIYPGWNRRADQYFGAGYNNLAVVKTRQKIPFISGRSDKVKLASNASIPFAGYEGWPNDKAICVTAGWGCIQKGGPPADRAYEIDQEVAKEECKWYSDDGVNEELQLCAGDKTGADIPCQGDAGNPLFCQYNGEYYHAGVLNLAPTLYPASNRTRYARTSQFYEWITNSTREKLNLKFDEL